MVLFENINVNQRVEVLRDGRIYAGTVKYKGRINGISGEWVGVELDLPGTYAVARGPKLPCHNLIPVWAILNAIPNPNPSSPSLTITV